METMKQQIIKDAIKPIISERLKATRENEQLTQEQMARRFSMSVRSYIDLEHGNCFPSAITFAQMLTSLRQDELKDLLSAIKSAVDPLYKQAKP